MKCPKCGAEMTREDKIWFCTTLGCRHSQDVETDEKPDAFFPDGLFYDAAFDSFYPLLAHECNVLSEFIQNKNYYAALLEYKDVVEIMLKFPVLIALNNLWLKDSYENPKEKEILRLLFDKCHALSLGDWKNICDNFVVLYEKIGKNEAEQSFVNQLKPLLSAVSGFYNDAKVVGWRNEKIGHGALQYNLESNPGELIGCIKKLREHLMENQGLYARIEMLDASGHVIHGRNCEIVPQGTNKIKLGDTLNEMSPFILVRENPIYLFDGYGKHSVYFLSYVDAKKKKLNKKDNICDLFKNKKDNYYRNENSDRLSDTGISDDVFRREEIECFIAMADEKELFTPPTYIIDTIKAFINDKPKGVLFMQMERGMGKTTLVRALDQLAMAKVSLDAGQGIMAVRAYYINNMFSYRINHFQNETFTTLTAYNEDRTTKTLTLSNIKSDFISGKDIAGDFAGLLNNIHNTYKNKFNTQKLLYIIDGLDEMRAEENEQRSIFDCIPSESQLNEGVYILLTGRTAAETSGWIKERYKRLEAVSNSIIVYKHKNESNKKTLQAYLENHLPGKNPDIVMKQGGFRFLHVKALRKLMQDASFNADAIGGNIIQHYMDVLKSKYGAGKFFNSIKRLLLIASLIEEPATISELAYLHDYTKLADLQFAGFLNDLKGLLRVDRTGMEESFSVSVGTMHEDWKQYLLEQNEQEIDEIIAGWVIELIARSTDYNKGDPIQAGESYIAASLYDFVTTNQSERMNSINVPALLANPPVLSYLSSLGEELYQTRTIANMKRTEKICTSIISIINNSDKAEEFAPGLASAYDRRGLARARLLLWKDALSDYSHCIKIREALCKSGKLPDEYQFANTYVNRGNIYALLEKYSEAFDDFTRYIERLEDLRQNGRLYDEYSLAMAYMKRGASCQSLGKPEDAIDNFTRSIDILESMRAVGKLCEIDDEIYLIDIYSHRGDNYISLKKYNDAINDFNRVIGLLESLYEDGLLADENHLAMAYMKRSVAFAEIGDSEKALSDSTMALDMTKKLFHTISELQEVYFNHLYYTASILEQTGNQSRIENLMEKYFYPLLDIEKTEAAEKIQNKILEALSEI